MKSNAFAKILESYAQASPLPNSAHDWSQLAKIFASAKTKEVADFVGDLQALSVEPQYEVRGLGALLSEIGPMRATAIALGKSPFADALEQLTQFVEHYSTVPVERIQAVLAERVKSQSGKGGGNKRPAGSQDPTIVPSYNKRLEEALGDEQGFGELMAKLAADQRLKANDYKQLAKTFAGQAGRNKSDALEIIRTRHSNLLDARTKNKFNAGKTAA